MAFRDSGLQEARSLIGAQDWDGLYPRLQSSKREHEADCQRRNEVLELLAAARVGEYEELNSTRFARFLRELGLALGGEGILAFGDGWEFGDDRHGVREEAERQAAFYLKDRADRGWKYTHALTSESISLGWRETYLMILHGYSLELGSQAVLQAIVERGAYGAGGSGTVQTRVAEITVAHPAAELDRALDVTFWRHVYVIWNRRGRKDARKASEITVDALSKRLG